MTSIKEKQVDKILDKIIGDGDEALKVITKLAMMNKEPTIEMINTLEIMKKQNEEDAKAIENELCYTMDMSGNMILIIKSDSDEPLEKEEELVFRLPVGKT
jgi:hypothetical protein